MADLAWVSVVAASLISGRALPDPGRISLAYRSDRVLTIDGAAPPVWSEYSGFWRTADGWIRTHGNYPHHAARLLHALELDGDAGSSRVRDSLLELASVDAVARIESSRGLAVAVRREDPADDAALRTTPLLDVHREGGIPLPLTDSGVPLATSQPLAGVRVLDLTRVIAGPVCTRTLALWGADVLRIDPPGLPEPEWQHLDTGHGKRSSILDARTGRFDELLSGADVVVLGYRPASLALLGLSPETLAAQHPRVLIAELSAWGAQHPDRAGFDSLVQAESGIAMIESPDGHRPGALPAQALDHSAGYLLAAAIGSLLEHRRRDGRGAIVRTSLRRIAAELLGMPRTREPGDEHPIDPGPHVASFTIDGRRVTTARSAIPGLEFSAPRRWGSDPANW